jgi:hypothetical protein
MEWRDIIGISLIAGILTAATSPTLSLRLKEAGLFIMFWLMVFFVDRLVASIWLGQSPSSRARVQKSLLLSRLFEAVRRRNPGECWLVASLFEQNNVPASLPSASHVKAVLCA